MRAQRIAVNVANRRAVQTYAPSTRSLGGFRVDHLAAGIGPGGGTPAEASAFVKEETLRWGDVIRKAGIEVE